jgi:photosystem II stability/assembly factor-like uncharacterized protein
MQRSFEAAWFPDIDHGYAFGLSDGPNAILSTEDGGRTWRLVLDNLSNMPADNITAISFLDPSHFWVLRGDGRLLRTTDGGRIFQTGMLEYNEPGEGTVQGGCPVLFFKSSTEGWGACGSLVHTIDGGRTWKRVELPEEAGEVWDVFMFDENEGVAVGGENPGLGGAGRAARTTDGGRTWQAVAEPPRRRAGEMSCTRDGFCAAKAGGQYGPVFVSDDRGQTWRDLNVPLMPGRQDELKGFRVIAANQVIIVGEDGGVNFDRDIRDKMGDIDVPHPPSRGLILKWDGTTWTRITHEMPQSFGGVFFVDWNSGWLFAYERGLYKTTDGGQTIEHVADYFEQIEAQTPSPTPFVFPTPSPPSP